MCSEIDQLKRRIAELERQNGEASYGEIQRYLTRKNHEVFNTYFGSHKSIKGSEDSFRRWKNREALMDIVKTLSNLVFKGLNYDQYSAPRKRIDIPTYEDAERYMEIYEQSCINISSMYF